MKLTRVRIQNFRSIEDTGEFEIDDLTCLVGKNEAGKTAILQALQSIRPHDRPQTKYDITQEYPRRFVTKYEERHPDGGAPVVSTWWELSDVAKNLLTDEFGENAINGDNIQITKHYKRDATIWDIPINEPIAVHNIIDQANLNAIEKKALGSPKTIASLITTISQLPDKTPKHDSLSVRISAYREQNIFMKGINLIEDLVPRFFYASHYDRMSGQISAKDLITKRQQGAVGIGDEIFLSFLELAGTSLEELQAAKRYEDLIAKCEAASNDITQQIFTYWTQNDALEVKLDFSEARPGDEPPFDTGTVVRARVWNTLHRASVPFAERSAGFVWFFSFLVQFAAMRGDAGNVVILLDEPGLTLHGKAQADLLRYIQEELLPHHQVVFSTHSPFMVPADRFLAVRIVEDVIVRSKGVRPEVKGTKVRDDVLVTDRDTLFPLQGALGYDLTQSLFVGKHTLLVEGPSDILYLQALSESLKRRQRIGLDPRWTLCPSGGVGNIRAFVSLFGANHLDIAVLTDLAKTDRKKIEELRRSEILQTGRVFTASDFTGKDEADVEDIFEPSLFSRIVNLAYDLPELYKVTPESLANADTTTTRLVKQAEAEFQVMPEPMPTYDHFTPAAWLLRNPAALEGEAEDLLATLDRAEKLFATFNEMLKE